MSVSETGVTINPSNVLSYLIYDWDLLKGDWIVETNRKRSSEYLKLVKLDRHLVKHWLNTTSQRLNTKRKKKNMIIKSLWQLEKSLVILESLLWTVKNLVYKRVYKYKVLHKVGGND